jgi:small subunit ribosomal protein S1
VLTIGQQLELKVLKVDAESRRVSVGSQAASAGAVGDGRRSNTRSARRITGTVTRLMDFGAFVELEPGIEGLIHVSEMSWVKKVHKPSDISKAGRHGRGGDPGCERGQSGASRWGLSRRWATPGPRCRRSFPSAQQSRGR